VVIEKWLRQKLGFGKPSLTSAQNYDKLLLSSGIGLARQFTMLPSSITMSFCGFSGATCDALAIKGDKELGDWFITSY